jgi:pimeloyl-ACP methyl ester carboxylesterase
MIRKDFKGILSYFERDNGKEDTIILLHGFQDTARGFYFLEDYLSHRFNILSPDWRGHGDSPELRRDGTIPSLHCWLTWHNSPEVSCRKATIYWDTVWVQRWARGLQAWSRRR